MKIDLADLKRHVARELEELEKQRTRLLKKLEQIGEVQSLAESVSLPKKA